MCLRYIGNAESTASQLISRSHRRYKRYSESIRSDGELDLCRNRIDCVGYVITAVKRKIIGIFGKIKHTVHRDAALGVYILYSFFHNVDLRFSDG